MKVKNPIPPVLAEKLLQWFIKDELAEEVLGDLNEKFNQTQKNTTTTRAKLNYWYQVLNYLRPFAIKNYRSNSNNNDMIRNYFKIGTRNLLKNKGYSFINVGGLTFGITVTLLIGIWIYDEVSFDRSNSKYDRIAQVIQNVNNNGETQTWTNVPFPLSEELRDNYGDNFKHICMAIYWGDHSLTYEDITLTKVGACFEKDFAEILDIKMIKGSANFKDPASILLSKSTAETYFGSVNPINQIMNVNDMPPVKVAGVYEDFPRNSTFSDLQFISSWNFLKSNIEWFSTFNDPWRPNFVELFVQIADNTTYEQVSQNIKDAKKRRIPEHLKNKNPELFLHPMSDWHLYSQFKNGVNVGGRIEYVWMFGIIAGFVLLLACVNFMNLNTARNESRAKEVGIRKAIGSRRQQLVFQFLAESILVVTVSYLVSLMLANILLPQFNSMAGKELNMPWNEPHFWMVSIGFILLTSFLAGSYPAFYLSSFKPVQVLKGSFRGGSPSSLPRKVLVIGQFTVSISLIIGTIVVHQQIKFGKDRSPGYERSNLVNIYLGNSAIHEHFDAIKNELLQENVITSMAESGSTVTDIWSSTSGLSWEGKDPDVSADFGRVSSSYDYGKTIQWKVIQGRDFSRNFSSDSAALILNESAIQYMGLENPVGQKVDYWDNQYTIIGVVEDIILGSPYQDQNPMIYFLSDEPGNVALLKLNENLAESEAIAKIESAFKKYNPEQPFNYNFVDESYDNKFSDEARIGKLSQYFAILAVLICCLGIFGLASFTAEKRAKEIGIRKVMGASILRLWKLLTLDFAFMILIAIVISAPLAYYYLDQWLANYTYHTSISWGVFVLAGLITLGITLLTVSYQAIKAASANPVETLRAE